MSSPVSRTRIYVGKVSNRSREGDLRDLFGKYGPIRHVDVKYGFAFVEFESSRDAEEAVRRLDGFDLDGSRLIVEFSRGGRGDRPRRERGPQYGPPQRSDHRASVENIPRDMSWQDLKDHFRAEADVIFADVWTDRSGRHCGAVEFRTREELRRAIRNLDGTEVRGCRLRIEDNSRRSRSRSRSRTPPRKRRRGSRSRSPRRSYSRSPRRSRRSPSRSVSRSPARSPSPRRSPIRSRSRSPVRRSRSRSPVRRSRSRSPVRRSRSRSPVRRSRSRSPVRRSRSRSPVRRSRSPVRSPARSRSPVHDDEPDAKRARHAESPRDD